MALERVTDLAELWVGEMRGCRVNGHPVVLVRLEDGVWAYADRCAHLGVALSGGTFAEGVITCPAHHYCYDARTGAGINPSTARLRRLPTQIRDGVLYVDPTEERS